MHARITSKLETLHKNATAEINQVSEIYKWICNDVIFLTRQGQRVPGLLVRIAFVVFPGEALFKIACLTNIYCLGKQLHERMHMKFMH